MDVATSTREQVRRYTEKGMTPREIALLLHVTTQNVYKHLAAIRRESEAKEASA